MHCCLKKHSKPKKKILLHYACDKVVIKHRKCKLFQIHFVENTGKSVLKMQIISIKAYYMQSKNGQGS